MVNKTDMVLVFDLDDTLYDELTYVRSGFRAVAAFLQAQYGIAAATCYVDMVARLASGRGRIFDAMLQRFGCYSKHSVRRCLSVYRGHKPDIHLYPEAEACLHRLRHLPIYIVTDGNKLVQKSKLEALGLFSRVNHCFITHCYGVKNAKPSPYCFWKICRREKVLPQRVVYVADNPHKDFIGIKPHGFKTVRVMQGQHKEVVLDQAHEAEWRIESLAELDEAFLAHVMAENGGVPYDRY